MSPTEAATMPDLSDTAIRANLDALAAPTNWPSSPLAGLTERLCSCQQTLAPETTPRRLVLFAADHGPGVDTEVGPTIQEIVTGAAATAVLARAGRTELITIDVGSRSDSLRPPRRKDSCFS